MLGYLGGLSRKKKKRCWIIRTLRPAKIEDALHRRADMIHESRDRLHFSALLPGPLNQGKKSLNDDRPHFIICFSSPLPRFLTRWQGCHPWGRARSFTSLMNMRTISNKCHRCPNCQIYSQLKKKIPSAGLFLLVFVTQALVCKIACSPAQNLGN